ncbi:MAG: tRNA 2-thiouridine(34) synthase MnmA [Gammaproteobacteria bacterium]|nr:tRNA 2-thiouridine(34) synthase MnmA [Gammaproteobacteria bacterium]
MSQLTNTKVIVGLSGGVDSAVAALLLKEQGSNVEAVFMQNWEDDDEHCTIRQDYRDAKGVADRLGIRLSTVNFADEYWERVFQNFLDEYSAGRTPNPDILCNREIKFKAFLEHALSRGMEYIATGHYTRVTHSDASSALLRGLDASKDQSYFLYALRQAQLARSLFPVGELLKTDVRRLAAEAGFHVHSKKDSTGICFIGERKFRTFLAQYLPAQPGHIVDESGQHVGQHSGLMYYTLGQRQGLGIGGLDHARDEPWYVLDKDMETNQLIVGQGHDHPRLFRQQLTAKDLTWCADSPPGLVFRCTARVRYRQLDQSAVVTVAPDGDTLDISFDDPVWAATPGQSLVLYEGERCLGGGIIGDFAKTSP